MGGELTKTLPPQIPHVPSSSDDVPNSEFSHRLCNTTSAEVRISYHRSEDIADGGKETKLQTHQTQLGLGGFNFKSDNYTNMISQSIIFITYTQSSTVSESGSLASFLRSNVCPNSKDSCPLLH